MDTPGADDSRPTPEPGGPMPSPASAPRPASGPTTSGLPVEGTDAPSAPEAEPIVVGDPMGGATATAAITSTGAAAAGAMPPTSGLHGDWPAQATDAIVNAVGAVRDRTTGPIMTAARALVFGLFAVVLGLVVLVMVLIALIRLLDEALPSGVWLPYLILGLLFVVVGAVVFHKRKQQPASPASGGNTRRR